MRAPGGRVAVDATSRSPDASTTKGGRRAPYRRSRVLALGRRSVPSSPRAALRPRREQRLPASPRSSASPSHSAATKLARTSPSSSRAGEAAILAAASLRFTVSVTVRCPIPYRSRRKAGELEPARLHSWAVSRFEPPSARGWRTRPCSSSTGNVLIDPGNMGQVVMNLVVNARDAMPGGGRVTVALADVVLDATHARENADAEARTSRRAHRQRYGPGDGFRGDAQICVSSSPSSRPRRRGAGPGSASRRWSSESCSEPAQQQFRSPAKEGVGTTFRIFLPCVDAPIDVAQPSTPLVSLRGDETILLVEDEEQVRAAAHEILRRYGYNVLEAHDGNEALRVCDGHEGTIDLVLSDVVMPRMGGAELAARLAATRPRIKVLCMSGYTDEAVARSERSRPGRASRSSRSRSSRKHWRAGSARVLESVAPVSGARRPPYRRSATRLA